MSELTFLSAACKSNEKFNPIPSLYKHSFPAILYQDFKWTHRNILDIGKGYVK